MIGLRVVYLERDDRSATDEEGQPGHWAVVTLERLSADRPLVVVQPGAMLAEAAVLHERAERPQLGPADEELRVTLALGIAADVGAEHRVAALGRDQDVVERLVDAVRAPAGRLVADPAGRIS